mmetsp:Transcript_7080/g.24356  ORF Transcript_7080/g.24356 Transcript_7080/m.24356 type:complete len:243 (-) Transcript_7080:112-840(-)
MWASWALLPKSCEIWLHGTAWCCCPAAGITPSFILNALISSFTCLSTKLRWSTKFLWLGSTVSRSAKTCLAKMSALRRSFPTPWLPRSCATPCTAMATCPSLAALKASAKSPRKNPRSGPFRHLKGSACTGMGKASAVAGPRSGCCCSGPLGPTPGPCLWNSSCQFAPAGLRVEAAPAQASSMALLACRGMLPGATVGAFPIRSASFSGLKGWFGPMAKGMGGAFRGCCPCAAESYPFPARN